ncbi:phage tail terminator family protein [Paenibacillus sp. MMS18-CY102]|uniref:phage tail terminator family protein n=1 Tax=Paenibacillus sp. MMS18-CY102 TaxID=2682849 RepID=UPI001365D82B|nr:hypothetical protein [Paenibacillus sp. MMS18-CY102]MWC26635.1 hypothetical protein [Paenibacillus sp. MMS18-CY102]
MIKLKQIAKAINDKLAVAMPHAPVQSTDISEGYSRPCLYVDFEEVATSASAAMLRERTVPVVIYYFPADRNKNKIELLEARETLAEAFLSDIVIEEGFIVSIYDVESVVVDGVLQVSFDILTVEINKPTDDGTPEMMELNMKLGE